MHAGGVINVADYERAAAEVLKPDAFGYFAGGAADERTLRRNAEAFADWELWPRVLVDVSKVSSAVIVLGAELELPAIVAPVAFQKLAHADGEAGMARAAASAGTIMCVSTLATTTPAGLPPAPPEHGCGCRSTPFAISASPDR